MTSSLHSIQQYKPKLKTLSGLSIPNYILAKDYDLKTSNRIRINDNVEVTLIPPKGLLKAMATKLDDAMKKPMTWLVVVNRDSGGPRIQPMTFSQNGKGELKAQISRESGRILADGSIIRSSKNTIDFTFRLLCIPGKRGAKAPRINGSLDKKGNWKFKN